MLSDKEITKRQIFYRGIFSEKVFDAIQQRQKHLWSVEAHYSKISGLLKRGFKDPICIVQRYPNVIGYSFKSIDEKILWLRKQGFESPIAFIERSPKVLGYSVTSMGEKIQGLKERGFMDPIALIKRQPKLLDLSFENIDRKIKLARRIGYTKIIELIEYSPKLLDASIPRCAAVIRVFAREKRDISFSCIKKTFWNVLI